MTTGTMPSGSVVAGRTSRCRYFGSTLLSSDGSVVPSYNHGITAGSSRGRLCSGLFLIAPPLFFFCLSPAGGCGGRGPARIFVSIGIFASRHISKYPASYLGFPAHTFSTFSVHFLLLHCLSFSFSSLSSSFPVFLL